MAYLRRLSLTISSFIGLLVATAAHSINIDTNRYDIYFGDVNGDGFEDVYFHGKEQFVPIAGDIFIPLILPPSDGFALMRNSRIQTVNTSVGYSENCGEHHQTYNQVIRENGVSDPEYIDLEAADIAGFRAAVEGVDYFDGDFNGDNSIDFLLRNLGANDTNNTQLVSSSSGNCNSVYHQIVVEGDTLAITLASTSGDAAPQILQTFTSGSFPSANILTAGITIEDIDADGRDDIVLNEGGNGTVFLAQSNGQVDLSEYLIQTPNYAVRPASFTGTTAGEFTVSESGAASYRIKLPVPVGTAGVQPEVSISYASNAGNGLLGKGWSLDNLSSISRCQQTNAVDGSLAPIQWNAEDRFCLNGQRLILVEGASYGAVGSRYKTEIDSYVQVMAVGGTTGRPDYFKVLRKDGSVTFYGTNSGIALSQQIVGNGEVLSWGQSRLVDSVGNQINFYYYNDSAGHRLSSIRYAYGTSAGVHNAEINFNYTDRADNISGYIGGFLLKTEKRLGSIDVRNKVDGQWNTIRTFNLSYAPTRSYNTISLLDAVQECVGSQCMAATQFDWQEPMRTEFGNSPTYIEASDPPGVDSDIVRDRRMFDVNGDGYLDMVLLSQNDDSGGSDQHLLRYFISDGSSLTAANFSNGSPYYRFDSAHGRPFNSYENQTLIQVLDYNGDGRQDIALYRTNIGYWEIHMSIPSGNDWVLSRTPINLTHLTNKTYTFVDFDGNGLADAVSAGKIYYLKPASTPTNQLPYAYEEANAQVISGGNSLSFGKYSSSHSLCSHSYDPYYWFKSFGDMDGDGDIDLVASKYTICSRETGQNEAGDPLYNDIYFEEHAIVEWTGQGFVVRRVIADNNEEVDEEGAQLIDINGDGLSDVVRSNDEGRNWYYSLSNGAGFEAEQTIGGYSKYSAPQFADINGDGKQDFVLHDRNINQIVYRVFDGDSFNSQHSNLRPTNGDREESHSFVDLNADRKVDYMRLYRTGRKKMNLQVYMATSPSNPESTITQITNGLGAVTQIHYETLADSIAYATADFELSYLYPSTVASPANFEIQQGDMSRGIWDIPSGAETLGGDQPVIPISGGIAVVSRVDSSSPAANSTQAGDVNTAATSSVAYQYSGARVQGGGRGFLGFQYLKTIDLQTNIKTSTLYRQDYPFTGAAQKTVTFAPNNAVMEVSENTWGYEVETGADNTVYYRTIMRGASETGYAVNTNNGVFQVGTAKTKEVITNNIYDDFGNPTQIIATTYGFGDNALQQTKTVNNQYGPGSLSLLNWDRSLSYAELGRLSNASVTTNLNGQATTRATEFSYYTSGHLAGLLHTETVEPTGAQNVTLTTTHSYDSMGNKTGVSTQGWDGQAVASRTATTVFDSTGRYVDTTYNHYNQRVEAVLERDERGSPVRTQDLAGIITTVESDVLGREIRRFDDSSDEVITTEYLRCNQLGNCPAGTAYATRQSLATGGQSITYFDIVGRKIREGSISFDGRWIYNDIEYDNLGRAIRTSEPFFANVVPLWNRSYYDILARPWRVIAADGTQQTMNYNGLSVTTINAFNQQNTEVTNVLDQLAMVTDHIGGRIAYEYNIDGELTRLHSYRAGSTSIAATTVLEYDVLGRKTSMTDPDKGHWVYSYNAFGELVEQTDAKQQRVTQRYDELGRMVGRTDHRSNGSVEAHTSWVYDNNTRLTPEFDNARGQLRQVIVGQSISDTTCSSSGVVQCTLYEYDDVGRQMAMEVSLGTSAQLGSYRNATEYDNYGRPELAYNALTDVVINNGSAVASGTRTHYNLYGYAYQTQDLQTGDTLHVVEERDQRGQVLEERRGNGATTTYSYDQGNGRLLHQRTTSALGFADPTDVQNIDYQWDAVGNLLYRHNQSANGQGGQKNLQESFCYDGLNRLIKTHQGTTTNLCGGLSVSEQDMEYDSLGNITRKHDVGTYTYGHVNNTAAVGDAGLHAVTATSDGYSYVYDNNGNMVEDRHNGAISRSLSYTTFDKPDEITKGNHTTKFAYGYDRSRYWREDTDTNGVVTTTLYLNGVERITKSNSTTIEWKRYLGHAIHTITTDASNNQQSLERLFVYKDHLGSTDVITDLSGQVVQSMSFDPWGQRRNADTWNPLNAIQLASFDHSKSTKGFTGHEHLDEVGLIHMNGRIYDPRLARFLQADPHIQAPKDTQMLNRYSYVRNNPLNATDPSGYFLSVIVSIAVVYFQVEVAVAAYFLAIAATVETIAAGGSIKDGLKAGVIAGVSAYAFGKIGENFAAKGLANGTSYAELTLYNFGGNQLTAGQIAQQIALHGLAGGVTAELQGGKFGHGFFSAGFTKGVMGAANFNNSNSNIVGRTTATAILGGTVSEATGGKFANGARTATMAHLFNQELSSWREQAICKGGCHGYNGTTGEDVSEELIWQVGSAMSDTGELVLSAIPFIPRAPRVTGFHGAKANNIDSIRNDGALKPNAQGEIYISGNQSDTFVHGADSSIGGNLSAKVTVDVSAANSVSRVSVPGNSNTILIKTDVPLPTIVESVKLRRPDGDGFKYEDY